MCLLGVSRWVAVLNREVREDLTGATIGQRP